MSNRRERKTGHRKGPNPKIFVFQRDPNDRMGLEEYSFRLSSYCACVEAGSESFEDSYGKARDSYEYLDVCDKRHAFGVLTLVFMACSRQDANKPRASNERPRQNYIFRRRSRQMLVKRYGPRGRPPQVRSPQ